MNSSVKNILIFIGGAAAGSVSTYFVVKKYFETKADREIQSVIDMFNEKVNEVEKPKSSEKGEIEGPKEIETKPSHSSIVERLNNKPDILDYTKYFKSSCEKLDGVDSLTVDVKKVADSEGLSEEELAEREHPEDDEPYTDEEDRDQQLDYEDYELNGEHKKALLEDKPPYEIEPSSYELECANYEKFSLIWYVYDELLANEADEIVDRERFVGTVIEDSGFADNDLDALYVRNDILMVDFEITKVYEEFKPLN